ncbi:MAG TPA: AgmX/PglI C-terminal domain-containing protein, partial [Polyangia bacterium]
PRGIDWTREVYLGGVTLAMSTFLFLVYAIPPTPESLALDLVHDNHFARFVLMAPELPPPPPMPGPANDTASAGRAAREKAGTLGKPTAQKRVGQIKLPGPVSRDKVLAAAQASAQNAGILGILRAQDGSHIGSLFGPGNPLGDNAPEILLGLQGTEISDGYGSGLDELGHDKGGGGDGDHTIGAGPLGTVGFCRGAGCRDGAKSYARSAPTADLKRQAHAPDVVPGQVSVKCGINASCLDREIVRRVIRQHHNEVRYCYERGLAARPELAGRIVTAFTIAATGRVLGSSVTDSSLRDRDVEECIAAAVRRWDFPSSAQMTSVSYPFILSPPR